ncbi:DUF6522 family protein [Roseibium litorale]|uniref:PepSY domain-containing protein n=1 Tax=Roseibium litorale TaxID=2803841 RepID=A0ABR9CJF7_9HYPH|nr:DUF6522 family protein [Roseibium litorale]MBD8890956.1 hypothetical protein [Roseibium litorale]
MTDKTLPDAPEVDAEAIAAGFGIPSDEVRQLMRSGGMTGKLYVGQDEDAGSFAYVLFHRNARLTLILDQSGAVVKSSRINFGDHPLPPALRHAPPTGPLKQ